MEPGGSDVRFNFWLTEMRHDFKGGLDILF